MPPGDSSISFRGRYSSLKRAALQRFAVDLSARIGGGRAFETLVAGDSELRRLNKRFRGKNEATDVLSFPSLENGFLGELAISYDRAKAQARQFGHPVETEIRILMLHGVLHLAGMDHETDGGEMARQETRWRKKLALPDGLIARSQC